MSERNVLALCKGGHQYIYIYDDESLSEVVQSFGRHACDPELRFTWDDASVLARRVHDELPDGVVKG